MPLDMDGFRVLGSIAAHPTAFRDIAKDINAAARTLVVKQIRSKGTSLGRLQEIHAALGSDVFNLAVDGLTDAQIKSLVGKLDKHHPELASFMAEWGRRHLLALANGSASATPKPKLPPKERPAKKKPATAPEVLNYASAGATRKRRAEH